jgi:AcrR family transcriptional regulator
LSASLIVEAAVQIADAEGLDAVSIRRIAAELDARPMSLYDHFESKDDLLAAMGDEVSAEVLVAAALPGHWRDALTLIARRTYALLVTHPWLVEVGRQQLRRLGPNATKSAEQFAEAVAGLNLDEAEMWTLVGTLNDYVLGHSYRKISAPAPETLEEVIGKEALVDAPELAGLPDWIRTRSSVERFEEGLAIVLDGIEAGIKEGSD